MSFTEINWNPFPSVSQCSHFKVAWAVSRACVNSESCSSSNLCCGQRFEEGRKDGKREKRREGGVGVNAFNSIMQSLQTLPTITITLAHCNHPFSPLENKSWNLEGRKWLNEWKVGKEVLSLIMSETVYQTPTPKHRTMAGVERHSPLNLT